MKRRKLMVKMMIRTMMMVITVLPFLLGCQSSPRRALALGAGSAAGGGIGYAVSDGNPWATVGGAAGGAALSSLILGDDQETLQRGFEKGYIRGNSDSIKRQYWLMQSLNESQGSGKLAYYSVPVEEVSPDGKELVKHTITVPIVE